MSKKVKCVRCETIKPISEMKVCILDDREYLACDSKCIAIFYKDKVKPDNETTLLGYHPVHGRLIAESKAKELIADLQEKLDFANEKLSNPQSLQELFCLEQMKELPLLEIHRAHQKLHEENNRLNERVKHLESDKEKLMSRYGDNWYDGFMTAKDLGFDRYSESEILQMSEAYEDEKIKSNNLSKGDQLINKFAIEKKIEALESFVLPYKQGVTKEYVKGGYGSLVLKAAQAEIEQLRSELRK